MALTRLQRAAAKRVVELCETARPRPAMFFGQTRPENAIDWIHGLLCGFQAAQRVSPEPYSITVIRKYHLKTGARGMYGLADQLRGRGLSDAEVVDHLLAIQIETWQEWIRR